MKKIIFTGVVVLSTLNLFAQDNVEEVIVTATKTEKNITGSSCSCIRGNCRYNWES